MPPIELSGLISHKCIALDTSVFADELRDILQLSATYTYLKAHIIFLETCINYEMCNYQDNHFNFIFSNSL